MKRPFFLIFFFGIFLLSPLWSVAQINGPHLLITWRAESYVPSNFSGKVLPTANSPITATIELIENNKLADLSGQTIYWYANNEFMGGGVGTRSISFLAPKTAGGTVTLRAAIQGYEGGLSQSIDIPVARPETVIRAPFPDGTVSTRSIDLAAYPYFFNVRDPLALAFSWTVNGEAPKHFDDPEILHVSLGPDVANGTPIAVSLNIQHPADIFGGAMKNINLVFTQ